MKVGSKIKFTIGIIKEIPKSSNKIEENVRKDNNSKLLFSLELND